MWASMKFLPNLACEQAPDCILGEANKQACGDSRD